MTNELHRLVGKLIVGKVQGTTLSSAEEQQLRQGTMSGVILFKENAESLPQLVNLIDSIRSAAEDQVTIAVDQEGGAVQRFEHILSSLPSQMALAASNDPGAVEKVAAINSRQLKLAGVNCLLAPVLDICSNVANPIIASRAFGDEPDRVADLGVRYAKTVAGCGVLPVGKHFPGHGDTQIDSHQQLATASASLDLLKRREFIPFRKYLTELPALMVGHISAPAIDPDRLPASLSYRVITGLLRNSWQFTGLVMADDLMMGAVTQNYKAGKAAVSAIAAGADLVLIGGEVHDISAAHSALMRAFEAELKDDGGGQLNVARLAQSIERINRAYLQASAHGLAENQATLSAADRIEQLQHCIPSDSAVCKQIMRSAMCSLRGGVPDLKTGLWHIIMPNHPRYELNLYKELRELAAYNSGCELSLVAHRYSLDPSADPAGCPISEEIASLLRTVKGQNCVLLGFRSSLYSGQSKLAHLLADSGCNLYSIEADVPSGIAALPELKNVLATFDPSDAAMAALANLLIKKQQPEGCCPVHVIRASQSR